MNNALPEKIIEEIKKQGITPRPRWHFFLKNWLLWLSASLSVLLGGIAIALIIFTFIDHDTTARAYLDETVFEELLHTVPFFWFLALAALAGASRYAVRRTKFGYRYTTLQTTGAVLVGSAVLGVLLHLTETAERIQDFLIVRTPYYDAITYTSEDAWSHPEKGLLGGTVTAIVSPEEFELADFRGKTWLVDFEEIEGGESLVRDKAKIKIVGTREDASTFRAARILPWK